MTTTLTQASAQWMSRPADQRFLSLTDMQAFKRHVREHSEPKTLSSRALSVLPLDKQDDGGAHSLIVADRSGYRAAPTHWSFGQLCSLASPGNSPASYFRETRMPAEMVADCLNYNLRFTRSIEDIGLLLTRADSGEFNELRSVNGPNYGRVYDAELVDALVERFGDGVTGQWRVPGEFGKAVTIARENTTLYASDRDMFVFLADEENRIEIPRPARRPARLVRPRLFRVELRGRQDDARRRFFSLRLCLLQPHRVGCRPVYRGPHPSHQGRTRPLARRGDARPRRVFEGERQAGRAGDQRCPREASGR
jgi:hypothetical protein